MSIVRDSRSEYESRKGANYSTLKHYARSPMHAREQMLHPKAPTSAMETGQALHMAVLEPEKFKARYVVPIKVDRRTTIGKAAWAEFEMENRGKEYLDAGDWESVLRMAEAIHGHPFAGPLFASPGPTESSAYWQDIETGAECKARLDKIAQYGGWTWLPDLKQSMDVRPALFASQVAKLGYHLQAAWYVDGLDTIAPHPRRWLWACVEPELPYAVRCYEPDEQAIWQGRDECARYLKTHLECVQSGVWPGYPSEPQELSLPLWAIRQVE